MTKVTRAVIICLLGILVGSACAPTPPAFGTLEGHVTIGPLVPVAREGEPEPTPAPEVYGARKIVVYEEDGETEVMTVDIGPDGRYSAGLPVGTYIIDINRVGIDSASELPIAIEIVEGRSTVLNIDIDTGIR